MPMEMAERRATNGFGSHPQVKVLYLLRGGYHSAAPALAAGVYLNHGWMFSIVVLDSNPVAHLCEHHGSNLF